MLFKSNVTNDNHADAPWYAIYTRHQHEKTVSQALASKGFETFLPLTINLHQWKDRTKIVSVALFPCYVFLKGDLEHRRLQILTTPGIYSLVLSGGQPAAIPAIQIEAIRRALESGERVQAHPFLKCGDVVRVKRGPLEGVEGILVRKKNVYRLVLTVEMLGKSASVEVDASHVERVKAARPAAGGTRYISSQSPESSLTL